MVRLGGGGGGCGVGMGGSGSGGRVEGHEARGEARGKVAVMRREYHTTIKMMQRFLQEGTCKRDRRGC